MSTFERFRRRLARDRRNGWIAGVCAGVGRYFGIDPVFPRVAFVVSCVFAWKIALVTYVVAWMLLPPRDEAPD